MDTPITRLGDLGGPRSGAFALTYDDGPEEPWTGAILDHLEALGAAATFFVIGDKIEGREALLRRAVALGCGVEVHAWGHTAMTEQDPPRVSAEIERTAGLIAGVTGAQPRFVRPPFGAVNAEVLARIRDCGLIPAFWSVHAADWTSPGTDAIVRGVGAGLRRGAVVLLHDGGGDRSQTVAATPLIVQAAAIRGLRPVRLGG
ncbi:polysaccharide deacetylase family protein [Dactylosporangium sp. CA-233914]|uniref:polysaccharide deacetylase family protein n=1 Tax=Dactylosporangium sp. CA-233914 TaxID=3239934 RepID=UPI003D8D3A68